MGVYTRYKRDPEGFRRLVELLESTPKSRRQKMIDVGMVEDPDYTLKALDYLMGFEDILKLPDMELAELLAKAPPKMTGYAIHGMAKEILDRFVKNSKPQIAAEIRDYAEVKVGPTEMGGAQLKLITVARELEKRGFIKTKKIPSSAP